jgi:hypothetical protein
MFLLKTDMDYHQFQNKVYVCPPEALLSTEHKNVVQRALNGTLKHVLMRTTRQEEFRTHKRVEISTGWLRSLWEV